MTAEEPQHIVANAIDVEMAGLLVQGILLSGRARMRIRISIPETMLVQTTDALIDFPQGRAFSLTATSIGGDERGPKPGFYANDAMRVPVERAGFVSWTEIEGVGLADLGYGMVLGVAGIIVCEDGTTALDPALAVEAISLPLLGALERSLIDVGWRNREYRAPVRAFLHDRTRIDVEVDLGEERGPGTVRTLYDLSLRPDLEAVFPAWPEADRRYDHDSFVRVLERDWPDDLSLCERRRGS